MPSRTRSLPAILLALAAASGCYRDDPHRCSVDAPGARRAAEIEAVFDLSGPGWTGGAHVRSVELPDGRVAWLSGFTFLGTVGPDGSRALSTPLVENSILLQDGAATTTLHGGTAARPEPLFAPTDCRGWYTPLDAIVEGDRLLVFLALTVDFVYAGRVDVASLWLSDLSIEEIRTVSAHPDVAFGMSLVPVDDRIYVYGVEDRRETKYLHVARAARADLRGDVVPWEYFDGAQWMLEPESSARLSDRVASAFGVVASGGRFHLVTQDTYFHPDILVFAADRPTGPFTQARTFYCTPETGGALSTFNAVPHPDLTDSEGLLVSYSVDSSNSFDLYADVTIARPRFLRLPVDR